MNISVIDEMKKFGFIELSIGKSATSLYNYYEKLIGIKSWPHNDFVTVLYLYGFIGLAFYIYTTILIPLKRIRFNFKSKVFITLVLAFILAFTNGFYTYSGMYLFILAYGVFYQEERDDMESRK